MSLPLPESPVTADEALQAWKGGDAGREDDGTVGIFDAVNAFVTAWTKHPVTANDLEGLYVIGGGGNWQKLTRGTYRLNQCVAADDDEPATVSVPINLVAVREPERGRAVLLDGNSRARRLWLNHREGIPLPPTSTLYVGTLHPHFSFAAACVSPLWRE